MHHVTPTIAARYTTLSAAAFMAVMGAAVHPARAAHSAEASCLNSRFADGHMVLHFDAPKAADHIVVATSNAPAHTLVRISDGTHSVALIPSSGQDARTEASLRAPLQGSDFTVTIDSAALSDDAVCITGVQLAAGHIQLAPSVESQPSAADDESADFVGTWHSSVSNTQASTLHIAADGSWQLETSQGVQQGSWQYRGGQLLMRLGAGNSFVPMHLLTQRVPQNAADNSLEAVHAKHTVLMLSAALIPELGGTFSDIAAD